MAEEKKKKDRSKWFREMRSELKKVVWPTASTTAKNTGTVLLLSLIHILLAYLLVYAYEETGAREAVLAHAGQRGEKNRVKRFNAYFGELMPVSYTHLHDTAGHRKDQAEHRGLQHREAGKAERADGKQDGAPALADKEE